jgi:hypothetical protein
MKARRGQNGLRERGYLALALLSLSIAGTGCIAPTEMSPETSSTESSDGRGIASRGPAIEGLIGAGGSATGKSASTGPLTAPQPSPWVQNQTPGDPGDPTENDPGTTNTSPQPSPWMTPPSSESQAEQQAATGQAETEAAPSPTGPSKKSSTD